MSPDFPPQAQLHENSGATTLLKPSFRGLPPFTKHHAQLIQGTAPGTCERAIHGAPLFAFKKHIGEWRLWRKVDKFRKVSLMDQQLSAEWYWCINVTISTQETVP